MTPEILAAVSAVLVAVIGAVVETTRLALRERVAVLEARVGALENTK